MATKTFKTRIKLKYDLQSAWDSSFSALTGELLLGKDNVTPNKVFANVGTEDGIKPLSILTDNVLIKSGSEGNETYQTLTTKLTAIDTALGAGGSVAQQIDAKIQALDVPAFQLASIDTSSDTESKIYIKRIEEVNGKIQTVEDNTFGVNIDGKYHEDTNKIATVATVTSAVETAQNTLQTNLSALKTRVDTAESEIDTLQSEMDAVEAKAAANETAISGLTTRVTIAEGEIDTLQSEMDAVEDIAATAVQTITGDENVIATRTAGSNGVTISHKTVNPTQENGTAITAGIGSTEISIPVISFDETGHIKNNGTQKVTITIPDAEDLGLSNALHFLGVTTTTLTDGTTTASITINGQSVNAVNGDVVLDGNKKEFVFDGTTWHELGDASANTTAISEINTKITDMDFTLTGATNKTITALTQEDGKITAATATDIAIPTSQVTTLGGYVALSGNYEALATTDNLNKALGKLERGIAINKDNITTNTNAIDAVEGRMSTAEGKIDANAAAIEANGELIAANAEAIAANAAAIEANAEAIAANTEAIAANAAAISNLHEVATTGKISDLEQADSEISDGLTNTVDMIIFDCGSATVNTLPEA